MKNNQIDSVIPRPRYEDFTRQFLREYLKDGFGATPKRTTDLHIFFLLETLGDFSHISNHDLSLKLQITESRVKSLRYESKLKFLQANDHLVENNILLALARAKFNQNTNKIRFIIEDTYTRKFLIAIAKELGGVPDSSFNGEIVDIEVEQLQEVIRKLFGEDIAEQYRKKFAALANSDSPKEFFIDAMKSFIKVVVNNIGSVSTLEAIKIIFGGD